jgi:hypothetical protein
MAAFVEDEGNMGVKVRVLSTASSFMNRSDRDRVVGRCVTHMVNVGSRA